MRNLLKKIKLKFSRWLLLIHRRTKMYLGRFLFALCIALFMLIACTNMVHRVPVFAYFIEELKFPIALKIYGKINVYDDDNNVIKNLPINIKIGGYEEWVYSNEEFELVFSATNKEDIPIVLEYQIGDELIKKLDYVSYQEKNIQLDMIMIFLNKGDQNVYI